MIPETETVRSLKKFLNLVFIGKLQRFFKKKPEFCSNYKQVAKKL